MPLSETLARVLARHDELRDALAKPGVAAEQFTKLSKEYAELTPVAEANAELNHAQKERAEAEAMLGDPEMQAEAKRELEALVRLVSEGKVKPHVGAKFDLKDAAEAQKMMAEGKVIGKILLIP